MPKNSADEHNPPEEPSEATGADSSKSAAERQGVRRQRDHITELTGEDPLASRDD